MFVNSFHHYFTCFKKAGFSLSLFTGYLVTIYESNNRNLGGSSGENHFKGVHGAVKVKCVLGLRPDHA